MAKRRPTVVIPKWIKTFPEGVDIEKFLSEGPKRVKIGIDATSSSIHIGHLVPLRIAKKLKDLGHEVTLVLGTATATLGDPSGQDKTRPLLSLRQVILNASEILLQARRVLGQDVYFTMNDFICDKMSVISFLEIASNFTINRMLSRDAFRKRQTEGNPIALHELAVPILQAWDSVILNTELEIGGVDQTFNFELTREIQVNNGLPPQVCILTPIISGTDGRKMSKSLGNTISFDLSPNDVFGRVMSVSDEVMEEWFPLFTEMPFSSEDPRGKKLALAYEITRQIWGVDRTLEAQHYFIDTFSGKKIPENLPIIEATNLTSAITQIRDCSRTEARRLIKAGAVSINGERVLTDTPDIQNPFTIQVGKRYFAKVTLNPITEATHERDSDSLD